LLYEIRRLLYKIIEIQVFVGAELYLFLPENIRQTPAILCQLTAFLCRECFFVEAGYGCLVLVASNVFAIANSD
jgi:hypothetical protein